VAVALMKAFELPPGIEAADHALSFAKRLHDAWGVGSPVCNNGVLLLMALDNRQVYISTGGRAPRAPACASSSPAQTPSATTPAPAAGPCAGSGAASKVPDATVAAIIGSMRPRLQQHQLDEAVEGAVLDLGLALAGKELAPAQGGDAWLAWLFVAVVAGVVCWSFASSWKQNRRYRVGGWVRSACCR
jgi:uncharacterized membrane protein YgcG